MKINLTKDERELLRCLLEEEKVNIHIIAVEILCGTMNDDLTAKCETIDKAILKLVKEEENESNNKN